MYSYGCFETLVKGIEEHEGGLDSFTKGYEFFGVHQTEDGGVVCREWAPAAKAVFLRGDFSKSTCFTRICSVMFLICNISIVYICMTCTYNFCVYTSTNEVHFITCKK